LTAKADVYLKVYDQCQNTHTDDDNDHDKKLVFSWRSYNGASCELRVPLLRIEASCGGILQLQLIMRYREKHIDNGVDGKSWCLPESVGSMWESLFPINNATRSGKGNLSQKPWVSFRRFIIDTTRYGRWSSRGSGALIVPGTNHCWSGSITCDASAMNICIGQCQQPSITSHKYCWSTK